MKDLTKEEAKKLILIKDDDMVHTFLNDPSIGLIGADHTKKSIFKDIKNSKRLTLAGEEAQKFGHALAIISKSAKYQSDILFVKTKEKEVKKLLDSRGKLKHENSRREER